MRGVLGAIGWTLAVVVIALGAAGIVAGMDAPSRGESRPELTAPGDARLGVVLDGIEADLAELSEDVDALGVQARGALAAQIANEMDVLDTAIETGDARMRTIAARSAAIAGDLEAAPIIGTPTAGYELSPAIRQRHANLVEALATVDDLEGAWARVTGGAANASRVSSLLAAHDDAVLEAAALGRDAEYAEAVEVLDAATDAIAEARTQSERLANTVDVTTLDAWLDRNEAYDDALRQLYLALDDVGGRVTNEVRDAIAAEKAAKDRLPPDSRGLVLIMSDIGRGGTNGAVIAIEEARGRLAAALEPALEPDPSAPASPTP